MANVGSTHYFEKKIHPCQIRPGQSPEDLSTQAYALCWNTIFEKYSVNQKKPIHLIFDYEFGRCRPSYKILSLSDSWGNIVHTHHNDSPPDLKYVCTLPCQT